MSSAKYFMAKDWEIYPHANKFNFFLQVYDENYNEVKDHPANDVNYGADRWRRINAQKGRAIKRAEKSGLTRIYSLPSTPTVVPALTPNKIN